MTVVKPLTPSQPTDFTVSIVEDEPVLRQEMAFQLGHHGFAVKTFDSAAAFYRYLAVRPRTLAVLDIGLPGEDGLSICRHLREHDSQMGIVFLTARALRDDRLAGLALGADAYLVKPVDMDELVLILKRLALRFAAPPAAQPMTSRPGTWTMAVGSGYLEAPNGVRVRLSLRLLLGKAGDVSHHAEIATALGLHLDEFSKHRAEVIVSRLRHKLARNTGLSLPLESVRGVGYRLA